MNLRRKQSQKRWIQEWGEERERVERKNRADGEEERAWPGIKRRPFMRS